MALSQFLSITLPADREPSFELFMAQRLTELDAAIGGYTDVSLQGASGNVDLDSASQARRVVVRLTGTPSAAVTVRIPATTGANAEITFVNDCAGAFSTVTIKSTGANGQNASGVSLPSGRTRKVRHNGNSAFAVNAEVNSLTGQITNAAYVDKSGDTMTGNLTLPKVIGSQSAGLASVFLAQFLNTSGTGAAFIEFQGGAANTAAQIGVASNSDLIFTTGATLGSFSATKECLRLSASGVMRITTTAAPGTNPPAGSFYLYVDPADNKLKARGSSGLVTPLANP